VEFPPCAVRRRTASPPHKLEERDSISVLSSEFRVPGSKFRVPKTSSNHDPRLSWACRRACPEQRRRESRFLSVHRSPHEHDQQRRSCEGWRRKDEGWPKGRWLAGRGSRVGPNPV